MEFGRKTEIVAGANFFAGVTVFVHGNDLFKHIFSPRKIHQNAPVAPRSGTHLTFPPLAHGSEMAKNPTRGLGLEMLILIFMALKSSNSTNNITIRHFLKN
jgi:hypothetical protein